MSGSLSNLVDHLPEGLHNDKCTDCKYCLDYMTIKDNQENCIQQSCTQLICFECKNNYEKEFNKELIKRFKNTYEFCNKDFNKFVLLLRKGAYPYEYMDSWERLYEASLPDKEAFYSL